MYVVNTKTKEQIDVDVFPMLKNDYKRLSDKYFFNWKKEQVFNVFKLVITENNEILGLISLDYIDSESRIEIRLLATSRKNRGRDKQYDRIAGILISFAARMAILRYEEVPCVSLVPKSELRNYYIKKYHMKNGGKSVFLDGINLIKIIKRYE